jgi:hypothetical protein
VIGGSLVMALGAGVIALSSVSRSEHLRWQEAATREGARYGVDPAYTRARVAGREVSATKHRRTWVDWMVVSGATATLVAFAAVAQAPRLALRWEWAAALVLAMLAMLAGCGLALWRTTRFS